MPKDCPRCGGWIYADNPYNPKSDIWCLMCGEWIQPPDFRPLPYVALLEDKSIEASDWYIDDNGDIIDELERKIERLIKDSTQNTFNVSYLAKAVHCSNYEARMTLDRLVRIGELEVYRYGPMERWIAYRKMT